jgi:hypothetical protein
MMASAMAYAKDGGFVFGVKPSATVQTSYFGMERGKFVFYGGLDMLAIGAKMKGQDVDWSSYSYSEYQGQYRTEKSFEYSGSATLIAPRLGVKCRLSSHTLRPYLFADLYKVFPFVNVKGEENTREYRDGILYDTYHNSEDNQETEDMVKDILDVWGFNLGFGSEYFFSENFSIGGEYVFRLFATSSEYKGEDGSGGGGGGYEWGQTWKDELSGSLKMSYAAIVLNYYF